MSLPSVTRTVRDPDGAIVVDLHNMCPPGYPHWGPNSTTALVPTIGIVRLFEAITPNSSKDHKTWKAFEHFKSRTLQDTVRRSSGVNFTLDQENTNAFLDMGVLKDPGALYVALDYGSYGMFDLNIPSWYTPRADGGFIPPPANLEQLKIRGLKAMVPRIKADLAGLVSLYEIKDIASIRGSIKGITKLAKSLFTKFGGLGTRSLGKAVARQAADGYLQWMFNLKPLISDIGGIYHAVTTYQKRINDLVSRSGKIQVSHFTCDLPELRVPVLSTGGIRTGPLCRNANGNWKYASGTRQTFREVYTDTAVFHSSMQFNYTFNAFQREYSKILGLMDALGINFNPRYVWEVIPWSFVVDWVVDVGRWLDQFEVKNMEPRINILQYCWSVKKERRIVTYTKYKASSKFDGTSSYGMQYLYSPAVVETSYRRGIDCPLSSSFTTSGLSSTELSLGAALLVTRGRKHRHTRKK